MRRTALHVTASIATLASVTCAHAEEQAAPTLQEIVVTGEKAARSLQETTASVAVVTARRLEQENVQSLSELFQRTANLSETYGSSGFTIRGMANQGVSGGGDAALTTIYLDGAPLPSSITFAGPTEAWDIQQIEIFRGPQSTLQGLNALAGAVVMRTTAPSFDYDVRARALIADPQETAFALAAGGPLVEDQLAFRISAEKRDSDGTIYNETRNAPEDPIDMLTLRGQLLWRPQALPGFEARLGYTRFEYDGAYIFSYASTSSPDFYDRRRAFSDDPNEAHVDADLGVLELTYAVSDRLKLSSVTSYSQIDQVQRYDGDGTAENISYGMNAYDFETLTQEVRLNYEGERLSGLIGAFYYDRDQKTNSASRTDVQTPVTTIAALLQANGLEAATARQLAGLYATALPVIPVQYAADYPMQVQTIAVFGDGEWELTDQLSLIGGFRWDHEKNRVASEQTAVFVGTYPDPAAFGAPGSPLNMAVRAINAGVAALVAQAGGAAPQSTREFDAFLPKLGLRYRLTPDANAAFVIQRGYRSGGSSANTARGQLYAYDPEYTWNYEASVRTTWLDGALTVNANAYYIDWSDQQVTVNFGLNDFDYHTVNAGRSHLYGAELEFAHKATAAFDWYGSVGYSKTEFDEFETAIDGETNDLSGSEFAYAPRWTLALGGNYRWGGGFVANLNASYRSSVYTSTGFNQDATKVGGRTLVNGRLGYETDRWGAYVYAKNLLDEHYMNYVRPSTDQALLGEPRVVGAMLQANW